MSNAAEDQDPRVQCYGRDCWRCSAPCDLYAAGIDRCREELDDRRISTTGILHDTEYWGEVPDVTAAADECPGRFDPDDPADVEPGMDSVREIQLEIVRRMADMYFTRPSTFDLMMRRAYFGDNQSALARHKGLTRQAVSKAIKKERDDKLRAENSAIKSMSPHEFAVYQTCCEDGILHIPAVVRQTGLSRATVFRVRLKLREKYGIVILFSRLSRKKSQKKSLPGSGGTVGGVGI